MEACNIGQVHIFLNCSNWVLLNRHFDKVCVYSVLVNGTSWFRNICYYFCFCSVNSILMVIRLRNKYGILVFVLFWRTNSYLKLLLHFAADIDECQQNLICDNSSTNCYNTPGNYTCKCKHGFWQFNGRSCTGRINVGPYY